MRWGCAWDGRERIVSINVARLAIRVNSPSWNLASEKVCSAEPTSMTRQPLATELDSHVANWAREPGDCHPSRFSAATPRSQVRVPLHLPERPQERRRTI